MRALSAPELLRAWEEGRRQPLAKRALLLLSYACPEEPRGSLLAMPIGRRDSRLLWLRERTFGPEFTSLARCPACGERLELSFSARDVLAEEDPASVATELMLAEDGWEVEFRLPNSSDLQDLRGDGADARRQVLEQCLLSARRKGRSRPVGRVPRRVLDAVARRMGESDPQADVHTRLSCPACTHVWVATFDIVSFFWAEIETWAFRTLREVHVLASAYGWREADILALSPSRRQLYLEMVMG